MYDAGLLHVFNLIERGSRFANSPSTHVVNLEDLNCEFYPEEAVNEREEDDCVLEVDEDDSVEDDNEDAGNDLDNTDESMVINERCVQDERFLL